MNQVTLLVVAFFLCLMSVSFSFMFMAFVPLLQLLGFMFFHIFGIALLAFLGWQFIFLGRDEEKKENDTIV